MKRTKHLFGLHSNDLTTSSVTQLLHETTDSEESGQKSSQKNSQTTLEQVYILIKNNPSITRKQLVEATGKASSYIQRCINQLKETKRIQRVGGDKGGFWEIIE
jgi:ATP-dependent DNA helicase RecG